MCFSVGNYPGDHGIIGNRFFDPIGIKALPGEMFFDHNDVRKTEEVRWFQNNQPIWATANEQGKKFVTYLWAR